MTELRRRMTEDMQLHGFSEKTRKAYILRTDTLHPRRLAGQRSREYLFVIGGELAMS